MNYKLSLDFVWAGMGVHTTQTWVENTNLKSQWFYFLRVWDFIPKLSTVQQNTQKRKEGEKGEGRNLYHTYKLAQYFNLWVIDREHPYTFKMNSHRITTQRNLKNSNHLHSELFAYLLTLNFPTLKQTFNHLSPHIQSHW